jgi:hypothetical protein
MTMKCASTGQEGKMDDEESAKLASTLLNDFVTTRDTKELQQALEQEFIGGGGNGAVAITTWFTNAFEKKDIPRDVSKVSSLPLDSCKFL